MSNNISCKAFQEFLVSQEPVYDREIIRDIRPTTGDLMGYYLTGTFDAYSGVSHTFDRFNTVFPNLTVPWTSTVSGACIGTPCDPNANRIGWGWTREQYGLEDQSWESNLLCFDQIMTRTRAKEHFRQIIDSILRPATKWIMSWWMFRKAAELADYKWVANSSMSTFTFTWDPGGYIFLNTTAEPTSKLTPNMLRSRVQRQYFLGAIDAGKDSYESLELHTDIDTYHDLSREDPTLKSAWRFADFDKAAVEFYKYGLKGFVGDFAVKCLQFPPRFNKISATRYQMVLPYKNIAADEGIKSVFNEDYNNAQYQFSLINNRRAMRVLPFVPEAVNSTMPFLVRDYGGRWRFVNDDLGADAQGHAIDNSRKNKGKFIADFRLAAKAEHPEWLELIFHMRDKPCITISPVCNTYPGYPAQSYDDENTVCACASQIDFIALANQGGTYDIAANTILVNGTAITHAAITGATLAALVVDIAAKWTTASLPGTWSVVDTPTRAIKVVFAATDNAPSSVDLPFVV